MRGLIRGLGVGAMLCVPRERLSGGLCILWKIGLQLIFLSSSPCHINVRITFPNSFVTRVTGFYGHPHPSQQAHSWELIHRLSQVHFGP